MFKTRAFTLIELLVVISVIAVLLAVLMPGLGKARGLAQGAACKGNMKGYTYAVLMYAEDNDDRFCEPRSCYFSNLNPYPVETGLPGGQHLHLRWCNGDVYLRDHPEYGGALYTYLKDARAFICPTFKGLTIKGSNDQFYRAYKDAITNYKPWYNYTMNGYLGPLDTPPGMALTAIRVSKVSVVKNPGRTFTFTEESSEVDNNYNLSGLNDTLMLPLDEEDALNALKTAGNNPWNVIPGGIGGKFYDVIAGFHHAPTSDPLGGKGNCALLDGHVDAFTRVETFPLAWPR